MAMSILRDVFDMVREDFLDILEASLSFDEYETADDIAYERHQEKRRRARQEEERKREETGKNSMKVHNMQSNSAFTAISKEDDLVRDLEESVRKGLVDKMDRNKFREFLGLSHVVRVDGKSAFRNYVGNLEDMVWEAVRIQAIPDDCYEFEPDLADFELSAGFLGFGRSIVVDQSWNLADINELFVFGQTFPGQKGSPTVFSLAKTYICGGVEYYAALIPDEEDKKRVLGLARVRDIKYQNDAKVLVLKGERVPLIA